MSRSRMTLMGLRRARVMHFGDGEHEDQSFEADCATIERTDNLVVVDLWSGFARPVRVGTQIDPVKVATIEFPADAEVIDAVDIGNGADGRCWEVLCDSDMLVLLPRFNEAIWVDRRPASPSQTRAKKHELWWAYVVARELSRAAPPGETKTMRRKWASAFSREFHAAGKKLLDEEASSCH